MSSSGSDMTVYMVVAKMETMAHAGESMADAGESIVNQQQTAHIDSPGYNFINYMKACMALVQAYHRSGLHPGLEAEWKAKQKVSTVAKGGGCGAAWAAGLISLRVQVPM